MPMQSRSGSATLPAAAEVGRMMQTYRAAGELKKAFKLTPLKQTIFLWSLVFLPTIIVVAKATRQFSMIIGRGAGC
jgi:hypothetical protein